MTALFESTRGGYMLAYCLLKQALTPSGSAKGEPPLWARTAAGAGANVVTWCVVYPIDVVRNVQVAHAAAHPAGQAPGWLACVRALLREDGPARLYRGYALTILRAGPVAGGKEGQAQAANRARPAPGRIAIFAIQVCPFRLCPANVGALTRRSSKPARQEHQIVDRQSRYIARDPSSELLRALTIHVAKEFHRPPREDFLSLIHKL